MRAQIIENPLRYAEVLGRGLTKAQLERYLPSNYNVISESYEFPDQSGHNTFFIEGRDNAGWTLDGYVAPRLASGLIGCREILA